MRKDAKEEDVSRKLIEDLLTSFLIGALGLELHVNIEELETLPASRRLRLQLEVEDDAELVWVAWQTNVGVVAATGRYDHEQSRRSSTHALLIEWWMPPDTHHRSWWRANPQHLTEWTAGRG
jgi:hypothetical protein